MPSPIAHSLAGAGLALLAGRRAPEAPRWPLVLAAVALANLPDLDFLPGLLLGAPDAFHRGPSHSLAAVLLCGAVAGLLAWPSRWPPLHAALWAATAYASHLLLDLLSADPDPEAASGIPLFWPFSDALVLSPWSVFLSIEKGGAGTSFVASLFTAHNLWAVAWEAVVLALPLALLVRWHHPPQGGQPRTLE